LKKRAAPKIEIYRIIQTAERLRSAVFYFSHRGPLLAGGDPRGLQFTDNLSQATGSG